MATNKAFFLFFLLCMPLVSPWSNYQHQTRFHFTLLKANPSDEYQMSWEPSMARRIYKECEGAKDNGRPFMVAVVGIPGSGKTICASLLANVLQTEYGMKTMVMPHDGYHYSLDQLKQQFSDSADAIYRRGAPDTFDPASLERDLRRIRESKEDKQILLPGFDHARGDPEPNQHKFDRSIHQVVICEGLVSLFFTSYVVENLKQIFMLELIISSFCCVFPLKNLAVSSP